MGASQQSGRRSLRSSDWEIGQLPGLSDSDRDHLVKLGITTTLGLLRQTRSIAQQQALAARLQIHPQHVYKWVALADLARVPMVGCQYCGLLLHAGIVSPAQLAQTPLPRLHQQLLKLQVATLQRQDLCPTLDVVAQWIQQARSLVALEPHL
ncbi:DUF4332 domain-containing protein [Oscillatoria sp. FACHB-1407]|uniref:DUF4332 domain-containing protein n=1 Tax=Oscillatoria sp. FACHB-1407 TaxID=2692847 RepID=UPI00168A1015|nr:DUF4332 domain-containing protein [Oscillatoria sp. FACHB-1407]MBD2464285.1 DUF4332 domain-containing protein [Oscillatoria sp. FACHB-1407]